VILRNSFHEEMQFLSHRFPELNPVQERGSIAIDFCKSADF
jgi:hypothetical protein